MTEVSYHVKIKDSITLITTDVEDTNKVYTLVFEDERAADKQFKKKLSVHIAEDALVSAGYLRESLEESHLKITIKNWTEHARVTAQGTTIGKAIETAKVQWKVSS